MLDAATHGFEMLCFAISCCQRDDYLRESPMLLMPNSRREAFAMRATCRAELLFTPRRREDDDMPCAISMRCYAITCYFFSRLFRLRYYATLRL